MLDTYDSKVDHSEDVELHVNKEGKVFGFKNLRFDAKTCTLTAEFAGDVAAGMKYLSTYAKKISELLIKN